MGIVKDSKILCVCTHNYFRSIITENLLIARGYINVKSAGTASAYLEASPSDNVLRALRNHGVKIDGYSARSLRDSDVAWAEFILCAEDSHAVDIDNTYKTHGRLMVMGIPDGGVDNSEAVEQATDMIIDRLNEWNL